MLSINQIPEYLTHDLCRSFPGKFWDRLSRDQSTSGCISAAEILRAYEGDAVRDQPVLKMSHLGVGRRTLEDYLNPSGEPAAADMKGHNWQTAGEVKFAPIPFGKAMRVLHPRVTRKSKKHRIDQPGSVIINIMDDLGRSVVINERNNVQLPCGKIRTGESPMQAFYRELLEETGFMVIPSTLSVFELLDDLKRTNCFLFTARANVLFPVREYKPEFSCKVGKLEECTGWIKSLVSPLRRVTNILIDTRLEVAELWTEEAYTRGSLPFTPGDLSVPIGVRGLWGFRYELSKLGHDHLKAQCPDLTIYASFDPSGKFKRVTNTWGDVRVSSKGRRVTDAAPPLTHGVMEYFKSATDAKQEVGQMSPLSGRNSLGEVDIPGSESSIREECVRKARGEGASQDREDGEDSSDLPGLYDSSDSENDPAVDPPPPMLQSEAKSLFNSSREFTFLGSTTGVELPADHHTPPEVLVDVWDYLVARGSASRHDETSVITSVADVDPTPAVTGEVGPAGARAARSGPVKGDS